MTEGVYRGIKERALADLSASEKRAVLNLLSRISEASYRRGAQQGVTFQERCPEHLPKSLWSWRYERSLDKAPPLDGRPMSFLETSRDRLFCEYWSALRHVGLHRDDIK